MPDIDVQIASSAKALPDTQQIILWCSAALPHDKNDASLAIRIVDEAEIQQLNHQYRGKDTTTNVLSFPINLPPGITLPELGDVVICAQVVTEEAKKQHKQCDAHWAHMVVHGTLHLQGYDHIEESDADIMESLETNIITGLGFPAPYAYNQEA